ncbi:nuclear transport factor 2 family protein [Deinococcus sp. QL22]|uniref:nuclear transport factor 2 family protein n=1 Tax=Deinococcus sp. QL22 TaxID=2939437 RepID=UPI0020170618|nr:nuclear transport factor 2 family protein [Deinococcus sp. QL22]UQN09370.1 nuclear transport factor 2 family protein [Deinococcus sp. QL22]
MSETYKKILETANAAVAQGDYEGLLRCCTEDTQWTFVGNRTLQGKEAVRQWMAATYQEPPKFDVQRMIAEHDRVVALGEITLMNEEGQATRYAYCDVWRFRGNKIAELQAFVVEPGPECAALIPAG